MIQVNEPITPVRTHFFETEKFIGFPGSSGPSHSIRFGSLACVGGGGPSAAPRSEGSSPVEPFSRSMLSFMPSSRPAVDIEKSSLLFAFASFVSIASVWIFCWSCAENSTALCWKMSTSLNKGLNKRIWDSQRALERKRGLKERKKFKAKCGCNLLLKVTIDQGSDINLADIAQGHSGDRGAEPLSETGFSATR